MPSQLRFARFAWASLALVVGVILWGAVVRATGSGAGCGSHWPTCNGVVLPAAPTSKTAIELTHRLTSGASALFVLAQVVWAFRAFPRGHRVRGATVAAGVFMLGEVAIGAALVLLEHVALDASLARAGWMGIHLCNTFLLLGAMALSAHWASAPAPRLRTSGWAGVMLGVALIATLLVGASGAVTALGDTLFPARTLASGVAQDLSPAAHVLVRLRVVHPVAAALTALLLLATRSYVATARAADDTRSERWGVRLRGVVLVQIGVGFLNLILLAPTWMQVVHLFLADAVWIALVLFAASALACEPRAQLIAAVAAAAPGAAGPTATAAAATATGSAQPAAAASSAAGPSAAVTAAAAEARITTGTA